MALTRQRSSFFPIVLLVILLSLTLGSVVVQAQAPPPPPLPPLPPFTLEMGHSIGQVIIPRLIPILVQDVSPTLGDVTLINRITSVLLIGLFDATAPYHPAAVGIYTRFERRPQEEWNGTNVNTAMLYAAYHSLRGLLPHREALWLSFLTDFGLDPADGMDGMDMTTAAAIGTAAGKGAVAGRLHDGMNQTGNYADTTGYQPVNTAHELVDASRWQPQVRRTGVGTYTVQEFVTPQMANVEPLSDFNPRDYRHPAPTASNPENMEAYKAQVDHILEASANLTDEQKMKAELFDNKIVSLGYSFINAAVANQLGPADFARVDLLSMMAAVDSSIVTWQEKWRYDAVRPITAVQYVYGDEMVTAWGGPGMGTMEIPASQWQSYIPVSDHTEYPSASTCGCYAHGQALRRYFETDELNWTVTFPAGSSRIEPGITPAEDIQVHFESWTEFEEDCGESRVHAGVHFQAAVDASAAMCREFGDMMYEYFATLMDGTAPERAPAQALEPDPMRFDRGE